MEERTKVILLGATGSIGGSALRVLDRHRDRLHLVGIAARRNLDALAGIAREFDVRNVGLFDAGPVPENGMLPAGARFFPGTEAIEEMVARTDADVVLVATAGTDVLKPTLAAIKAGRAIALASKEILVVAGAFVAAAARAQGVNIIPVDSEHNAVFQCLECGTRRDLRRIILTASGGSLREVALADLAHVTPEQALAHPNWSMGDKITIDSATMANKGLEIIEAHWLFAARPGQIDVVLHPQSIVHSMVEFVDGSILAQLSPPSMTFAIQHALLHPDRFEGVDASLDFTQALQLDFRPPEPERYPCLGLARDALAAGGAVPAVFNAANEIAVAAFLAGRIGFLDIPTIIRKTMDSTAPGIPSVLDDVLQVEAEARRTAGALVH